MAAVADNAASVAGAERDYAMLDFAIETYERLLERTTEPQREAVSTATTALGCASEPGASDAHSATLRPTVRYDNVGQAVRAKSQETLGRVIRI